MSFGYLCDNMKANDTTLEHLECRLPVMEQFYTVQGEGFHTGKAAYFIRLGGCDVGCHWCDVKDSWNADKHPMMSVKEIVCKANNHPGTIVVTGGEPLMWDMTVLTEHLKTIGMQTHLETSGAYPLSGKWDWICLSPKKRMKVKSEVYKKADELKIIAYNNSDFSFAEQHAKLVSPECMLYLQPEWSRCELMIPKIVDYVKSNPRWLISLQTHKYLNIP